MVFCKYLFVIIYPLALFTFGIYIKLYEYADIVVNYSFNRQNESQMYDYIIVGCGSAGSIMALRLTENPAMRILVLEAGGHGGILMDIPGVTPLLQLSDIDWQFRTVPQNNACRSFHNNVSSWPMGKIVGGSNRLNNLIYLRGHPDDYKSWYNNLPDFNYNTDILPYFKKTEFQKGFYQNDTNHHGFSGPLIVQDIPFVSSLANAFLKAVSILGFPVQDLNGEFNFGFMKTQAHLQSGSRSIPAHNLNKKNLILKTNALAEQVLFRSNYEAYGVRYSQFGEDYVVKATKGVILSAGVIGTPKLLMLSGIGSKLHLENLGIDSKIDLPVGDNLQDHVSTGLDLIIFNRSIGLDSFTFFSLFSAYDYFFNSNGPWTVSGSEVIGVLSTNNLTTQPDLQLMVIPIGISSDRGFHLKKALGLTDEIWNEYFSLFSSQTTATILPIVLHPKSRGYVRLKDKNPNSQPVINPNYLTDPQDVDVLISGIKLIKKIINTEPMQQLGAKFNDQHFPRCGQFKFDSYPYWDCYVRHVTLTVFHPSGTCKMGNTKDQSTVVDYEFKVVNSSKLYVVDASVLPSLPSANINAAVMMLAEKAAVAIRYHKFLSENFCQRQDVFLSKEFVRI